MSGRQLIQGRDVNDLFFWQNRTLAFTRDTSDPSQPEPQDFLVWPIDEPSPSMALAGIDWGYPHSWPVWFTGDLLMTGPAFERVYSIETRQSANMTTDFPAPVGGEPVDAELPRAARERRVALGRARARQAQARHARDDRRRPAARPAGIRAARWTSPSGA